MPLTRQAAVLYGATLASARLRELAAAQATLARLSEVVQADPAAARLTSLLEAELALLAGQPRRLLVLAGRPPGACC